ncbi:haloacetate dehalogenase [Xanthobacter flavus]|uniref:Haloacetate dehalogenase n=1 Tax=Xanthobacter flavus TaxID=281 RepID=A0A9W6CSU4_XANFL|nr:alpha/beta hydrolase [Xanthobacter flavus]MDR6334750.1 haloacetate dehalogenase [Xanthobacter flavus]GLI23228.1 haloacetate dehalogenase [Xanthobacter flavus]
MSDLSDLFPGFASHYVDTKAGRIFLRQGGTGAPLLLLHGFPQSHVMWHRVAPKLAEQHTLIIPDLPGYGWSAAPEGGTDHFPYSKRAMAAAMVEVMESLGFAHFSVMGHDRGARAAYRLGLDHPGRLDRLVVLDIVPTYLMWHRMDRARALQVYHWAMLAQPKPLPEKLVGANPAWFLDWTMASWTAHKDLSAFDPRAMAAYRAAISSPDRLHAMCEDYRAGATIDLAHDEADIAAARTLSCPTLALWGAAGIPSRGASPLEAWKAFAPQVEGQAIEAGHFLAEEAPKATLDVAMPFLAQGRP